MQYFDSLVNVGLHYPVYELIESLIVSSLWDTVILEGAGVRAVFGWLDKLRRIYGIAVFSAPCKKNKKFLFEELPLLFGDRKLFGNGEVHFSSMQSGHCFVFLL